MLVNWTLENFKSVAGEISLPLSPITVLVGANSSGKSSIIQSILLIKQTLQYATSDRAIALNGPLIKLGNYDDIRNVLSAGEGFRISWKYDTAPRESSANSAIGSRAPLLGYRAVSQVEYSTQFGMDPKSPKNELSLLQPVLMSCRVRAVSHTEGEEKHSAEMLVERKFPDNKNFAAKNWLGESLVSAFGPPYSIRKVDKDTKFELLEDHPNGSIVGAVLRHFSPYFVAIEFDVAQRRASQIADAICTMRKSVRFQKEYGEQPLPASVAEILDEWLQTNSEFFSKQKMFFPTIDIANLRTVSSAIDMLHSLRARMRTRSGSFPSLQELQPRLIAEFIKTFKSEIATELERPRLLSDASIQTREYFEQYVRYLGPLRDEPKPLYPLEALANPTDVGYRGEHTAAVLHLNQLRDIQYVPSSAFLNASTSKEIDRSESKVKLQNAVVDWLSYMGVVEGVLYRGPRQDRA
jgi:hypothetical protein